MPLLFRCAAVAGCLLIGYSTVEGSMLYDASLNTSASAQGFTLGQNPPSGGASTATFNSDYTRIDSSGATGEQIGYFSLNPFAPAITHPGMLTVDAASGFTLNFNLMIEEESHVHGGRAGFSIIILDDNSKGMEIGFWDDEVFVYHDDTTGSLFTKGESAVFDTTTGMIDYELQVLGSSYQLKANGSKILTGAVRDYTAFSGPIDPYEYENFIFWGDDTGSASSISRLGSMEILASVPEPGTMMVLGGLLAGALARRRQ
ncbi:hypothetical protein KS4_14710 [Poriferisphaera corsica]|uniref:Ice-binding protein C-terminal domain-containing protein n=1 Tax=Poriferisphaera corsica TaxID=2528020 RepID=A0A517YT66_9BACT|nr:PEP-CTERM sorting domain-containing protein [Poriferisphaera corsica]QDU33425.1 hypothetical protein KS4_14710 [Poriferisphaera corsica]